MTAKKRQILEERLAEVNATRADPASDRSIDRLRQALGEKNNHLAAAAARIVGEFELGQLEADLVKAFDLFMTDPVKRDPGCTAKAAIAEALYRLGHTGEELFLRGMRHVQPEPTYGGKEDTAAKLRGACGLGLVRANHPHALLELARLLADPRADARIAAVRAIAACRQEGGVPLLAFKTLTGDANPQVLSECFGALLSLAPDASLPLVAGFLDDEDAAVAESAALALGESRLERAFDPLRGRATNALAGDLRRTLLLAIALLRHEQAISFLLDLLAAAPPAAARDALAALETYRGDEQLWRRVQRIVEERDDVG